MRMHAMLTAPLISDLCAQTPVASVPIGDYAAALREWPPLAEHKAWPRLRFHPFRSFISLPVPSRYPPLTDTDCHRAEPSLCSS